MKPVTGLVSAAAITLLLSGCATELARVDLNGDGKEDRVSGQNGEGHYYYFDYEMIAELSAPDGTYRRLPRGFFCFRGTSPLQ